MDAKNILVTGGAGYIGSHVGIHLKEMGYNPIIIDNFSTGHRGFPKAIGIECHEMGIDNPGVKDILRDYKIASVMHFSASSCVGESVTHPHLYYQNNFVATMTLLDSMLSAGVKRFVFSSTCAVYGNPQTETLSEEHPLNPVNPYGQSKQWIEQMLSSYDQAFGLKSVSFRYFNAAGADPHGRVGEDHRPETHLIPLGLKAALQENTPITVFGNDYQTKDGTCIRDYIHVLDLASAHVLGVEYLNRENQSNIFNLGSGHGYTVLEVLNTIQNVCKKEVAYKIGSRRAGDPPRLVAGSTKAQDILGWQPKFNNLEAIIASALAWYKKRF